jgi:hypothetical protein
MAGANCLRFQALQSVVGVIQISRAFKRREPLLENGACAGKRYAMETAARMSLCLVKPARQFLESSFGTKQFARKRCERLMAAICRRSPAQSVS